MVTQTGTLSQNAEFKVSGEADETVRDLIDKAKRL